MHIFRILKKRNNENTNFFLEMDAPTPLKRRHATSSSHPRRKAPRREPPQSPSASSPASRVVPPDTSRDEPRRPLGIIIGQAPPASVGEGAGEGFTPLSGLAERRLARLAGLEVDELWHRFDRHNLLSEFPGRLPKHARHQRTSGYALHQSNGDAFPMEQARAAAAALDLCRYRLVVLLGLRVAAAFKVKRASLLMLNEEALPCPLIILPHTSGVSHFWNDAANVAAAEHAFRDAIARFATTRSRFFLTGARE